MEVFTFANLIPQNKQIQEINNLKKICKMPFGLKVPSANMLKFNCILISKETCPGQAKPEEHIAIRVI
jgi:hypothetical protein